MPSNESPGQSVAIRRRRWRWWILLVVLLIAAGWFARYAYLRIALRPTPCPEYWEAELAVLDPAPPGAISPTQAFTLLMDSPWDSHPAVLALLLSGSELPSIRSTGGSATATAQLGQRAQMRFDVAQVMQGPWDTARPEVAAVVAVLGSDAFKNAHAALARGVQAGWHEGTYANPSATLPLLHRYRVWTGWLVARSRWLRKSTGDLAGVKDDWLTAIRLARQVRRPQVVIFTLSEAMCNLMVTEEMMLAAGESKVAIDTCGLAREVDRIIGPVQQPGELIEGTRLCTRSGLEFMYISRGGNWVDVSELVRQRSGGSPSRIWNLASPLFHDLPTAKASVDRYFASMSVCTDMASAHRAENSATKPSRKAEPTLLDGFPPGSNLRLITPRAIGTYYAMRSALDAGTAMLAIHAFHLRRGRYPEKIDELVPEFLPRLPIDYADRQPLRYRREADDYVLYSIGADGKDDGGVSHTGYVVGAYNYSRNTPDIVYTATRREEVRR